MRTRISAVITIFVIMAFVAIGAATGASAAPTFRIEPGQYPWHVWNNPAYKQAFPDQHEFFCRTADLSGLQFKGDDCEEPFRHLAAGTIITFPELPGTADNSLQKENNDLRTQLGVLQQKYDALEKAKQTPAASSENTSTVQRRFFYEKFGDWWMLAFGLAAIGFILALYFWNEARIAEKERGVPEQLDNSKNAMQENTSAIAKELRRLQHYANLNMVPVWVPEDIGTSIDPDSQTINLQKADPIDDEPAVYVPGFNVVKLKNVKGVLNKADEEQLKAIGIIPKVRVKEPELPLKQEKAPKQATKVVSPDQKPGSFWDPSLGKATTH